MSDLFEISESDEDHWISVSDLMAVLMMVFLLIVIVLQNTFQDFKKDKEILDKLKDENHIIFEFERIKNYLKEFENVEIRLRERLTEEFDYLFRDNTASLDPNELIIRFNDPRILFKNNESTISLEFRNILEKFFPKYVSIINEEEFKKYIAEIRIEGHTSSIWRKDSSKDEAYFGNMKLSQERTRAVLEFGLSETSINESEELKDWAKKNLTANGLSSSQLIIKNGKEDKKASRRVEFEIRTNFEEKIFEFLKENDEN